MATGVYKTTKKDGTVYYRVSITYRNKHISLGSTENEKHAAAMYKEATNIINKPKSHYIDVEFKHTSYKRNMKLSFDKYIILINFRDNDIYIKTPIYLCKKFFLYFLSEDTVLEFGVEDLFYYSNHTIQQRGGYLFVSDYGMQISILSRYGIHSHSVVGRDYYFKNGDENDFRYDNLIVVNKYFGVSQFEKNGRTLYKAKIHINGEYTLGSYSSANEAAIAYNKAVDMLEPLIDMDHSKNYIEEYTSVEYARAYHNVKLAKNFRAFVESLK